MLPAADVLSLPAEGAYVLAETIARRAYDLARLLQLHLHSDSIEYSRVELLFPCMPWLLDRAKNLSLLDVHLGSKAWLPPLTNIKHLILVLQDDVGNV